VELGVMIWLARAGGLHQRGKYRNGLATQVEVLISQNERARRANLLRTDENLLSSRKGVAGAVAQPAHQFRLAKVSLAHRGHESSAVDLMVEHATTMAPQLDVMRGSLRQAESSVKLARKQRLPDVTIGLDGRQYSGPANSARAW